MRQLNIRDHQVRLERARGIERQPAVADGMRFMAVRRENVAEQLDVEGVVLDDQDLGQLASLTLVAPA